MSEKEERGIVDYDGKCPLCGSSDGTIIQGADGKYRNMCRVMGCPAFYLPVPAVGFDTADDCTNEEAEEYFQREIDAAKLREAVEALQDILGEPVRIIADWLADLIPVVCQAIEGLYREKPPRPDYKARPKCCTKAKTKRHRKQRSRER